MFGLREGFFGKITIFNKGWRKHVGDGESESEVRFHEFFSVKFKGRGTVCPEIGPIRKIHRFSLKLSPIIGHVVLLHPYKFQLDSFGLRSIWP